MQLFYVSFAYSLCCMVYDIVDTTKMIDCFYDVIDRSTLGSYADGVGLEDVTCLFFCETIAFDMLGIVGQINLCAMIDASVQLCFLLVSQSKEQRAWLCGEVVLQKGYSMSSPSGMLLRFSLLHNSCGLYALPYFSAN